MPYGSPRVGHAGSVYPCENILIVGNVDHRKKVYYFLQIFSRNLL